MRNAQLQHGLFGRSCYVPGLGMNRLRAVTKLAVKVTGMCASPNRVSLDPGYDFAAGFLKAQRKTTATSKQIYNAGSGTRSDSTQMLDLIRLALKHKGADLM